MKDSLLHWVVVNADWVFSGIGVTILGLILNCFKTPLGMKIKQDQKSGKNSTNIQVIGDVKIDSKTH